MAEKHSHTLTMYGTTWCFDCKRIRKLLDEREVSYSDIDIEQDPQALAQVLQLNSGAVHVPTIVFADGSVLVEPSSTEMLDTLSCWSH